MTEKDEKRFWAKVDRSDAGGCWLWLGAGNGEGYGRMMCGGQRDKTHRIAYRLCHGEIPDGMLVCHRCDVPACVNPAHLFLGTNADNISDRNAKGRQSKGSHRPQALLDESKARAIRIDPRSARQIAEQYGISRSVVRTIKAGIAWRHV